MRERKERGRKRQKWWVGELTKDDASFGKNKNVSKQCLFSLSKVKVYDHLIISLTLYYSAQFGASFFLFFIIIKKINTFIPQGCIKFLNSKIMYNGTRTNVTKKKKSFHKKY